MAMNVASSLSQMCLLKDAQKELKLDQEKLKSRTGTETILFYAGNMLQKSNILKASNNDQYLLALLEMVEDFSEDEQSNRIELDIIYESIGKNDNFITVKIQFSDLFVKKLSTVLEEPKISINGILRTNLQSSGLLFGFASAYGLNPKPISKSFSATGLIKSGEQLITDFEGANDMKDYIKNCTLAAPSLTLIYSVKLQWTNNKGILKSRKINVLKKLQQEKLLADCCIVASNKVEMNCHRNILAAHSEVFLAMFTSGLQESHTNRIEMKDISEEGVNALINYFYQSKIDNDKINDETAFELLQMAHQYNISNLESVITDLLYLKSRDWFSLETALSLYYFTLNIEAYEMVRDKMLGILKSKKTQLFSTEAFQDFLTSQPEDATRLRSMLND